MRLGFLAIVPIAFFTTNGLAQDISWPGLPPDCWTESRLVHLDADDWRWEERTIERVDQPPPEPGVYSPNEAYYFKLTGEPPTSSIVPEIPVTIFAEKDYLIRITFTDLRALNDVRWINEKLLYMRSWWGRIAATDIIYDVEKEEVVWAASVTDGRIAMQQFRESCALRDDCECVHSEQ